MPAIYFEKEDKTVVCNNGINLRQLALAEGIELYSGLYKAFNCRGNGLCGSCEVEVIDPTFELHQRTRMEEVKLAGKPLIRRLACQLVIHGPLTVRTHPLDSSLPTANEAGKDS